MTEKSPSPCKKDPYKKIVRYYDTVVGPFNRTLRKIVLKTHPPEKGMRVFEPGCGTGANLALYQRAGCEAFGMDLSPAMAEAAGKKLGDQADIRIGDASRTPHPDGFFDISLAMLTLHEMPASVRLPVIREMARTLKPAGRALLVDFHPGPIEFPGGWIYKTVISFFETTAGREHFRNYRDFMARGALPPLIRKAGLRVEKERILGGGNLAVFCVKPA
ncbi:conserved hypothetical protein [Candidatus Desulfarcum epimagneticum]|uniref:Methyltransferase type 11 domain-containing protein n=1 Tax=uncultured Desulfobacteraceae bacterium TaxID=218296 RepID=A0A484HBH5_9BACT|nr:conserved hypothetical protein [uncultured Desulfobacteraceae bacterium]